VNIDTGVFGVRITVDGKDIETDHVGAYFAGRKWIPSLLSGHMTLMNIT
jgi:hypothetical protein